MCYTTIFVLFVTSHSSQCTGANGKRRHESILQRSRSKHCSRRCRSWSSFGQWSTQENIHHKKRTSNPAIGLSYNSNFANYRKHLHLHTSRCIWTLDIIERVIWVTLKTQSNCWDQHKAFSIPKESNILEKNAKNMWKIMIKMSRKVNIKFQAI